MISYNPPRFEGKILIRCGLNMQLKSHQNFFDKLKVAFWENIQT